MKKLLLIIPILFACATPKTFICTPDLTQTCYKEITFKKEKEQQRVYNRYVRNNMAPYVVDSTTIEFSKYQIEFTKSLLLWDYSLLRNKYNDQIIEK